MRVRAERQRSAGTGAASPFLSLTRASPRHHRLLPLSTQSRRSNAGTPRSTHTQQTVEGPPMDIVHHRCCGLDIHKKILWACLITLGLDGKPHKQIRPFGTMTANLLEMAAWLERAG